MAQITGMPGLSELAKAYSQFATVPGFKDFQSGIVEDVMSFAMKQTLVMPTGTDPAALATDPAVLSMASGVRAIVSKYVATQTFLAGSAKESIVSALEKAAASGGKGSGNKSPAATDSGTSDSNSPSGTSGSNSPSGTSGSNSPSGTGISTQKTAGASRVMGMGALLAAGVAAIALL